LFFEEIDSAVDNYQQILGPPAHVEGEGTRGWQVGFGWLTLLRGKSGSLRKGVVTLQMDTPKEAERLQRSFIAERKFAVTINLCF